MIFFGVHFGGVPVAKLKEYVMGEEEANKMEASEPKEQQPVKEEKDAAAKTDVAEEKSLIPVPESMLSLRV